MKICLDIETTGLSIHSDEILQISILDESGKVLINELIKPKAKKAWYDAENINHISSDMVKHCKHISFYKKKILKIINNADIIIGFNHIHFDIPILEHQLGIKIDRKKCYDVMSNYVKTFTKGISNGKIKLIDACEDLGIKIDNAHNSFSDCLVTLNLYNKIIKAKNNHRIFDKTMHAYKINTKNNTLKQVDINEMSNYIKNHQRYYSPSLLSSIKSMCKKKDKYKKTYFYFYPISRTKIKGHYLFAINTNPKIANELLKRELEFRRNNNVLGMLSLSYKKLCEHLIYKYGRVNGDYYFDELCKNENFIIKKPGLHIHHIMENIYPFLSKMSVARRFPFECQKAENLVYSNLIEHLILHICIVKETKGKMGYYGMQLLYNDLINNYIYNNKKNRKIQSIGELYYHFSIECQIARYISDFKYVEEAYINALEFLSEDKIIK